MLTLERVTKRALRGFAAGFVSTMLTLMAGFVSENTADISNYSVWYGSIVVASINGGIVGCLMAVDKYLRTE